MRTINLHLPLRHAYAKAAASRKASRDASIPSEIQAFLARVKPAGVQLKGLQEVPISNQPGRRGFKMQVVGSPQDQRQFQLAFFQHLGSLPGPGTGYVRLPEAFVTMKTPQGRDARGDALNHLGEREYQTYSAWRAAAKAAGAVRFEGDKDIATAFNARGKGIGQWEGDKGSIYKSNWVRNKDAAPASQLAFLKRELRKALEKKDRKSVEEIEKEIHELKRKFEDAQPKTTPREAKRMAQLGFSEKDVEAVLKSHGVKPGSVDWIGLINLYRAEARRVKSKDTQIQPGMPTVDDPRDFTATSQGGNIWKVADPDYGIETTVMAETEGDALAEASKIPVERWTKSLNSPAKDASASEVAELRAFASSRGVKALVTGFKEGFHINFTKQGKQYSHLSYQQAERLIREASATVKDAGSRRFQLRELLNRGRMSMSELNSLAPYVGFKTGAELKKALEEEKKKSPPKLTPEQAKLARKYGGYN